jgi:hypothetical protein
MTVARNLRGANTYESSSRVQLLVEAIVVIINYTGCWWFEPRLWMWCLKVSWREKTNSLIRRSYAQWFFFKKMDGTFGHSIGMHGKFYQEIKERWRMGDLHKKAKYKYACIQCEYSSTLLLCVMCKDDSRAYCLSLLHKQSVVLHIFMICS